MSKLTAAARDLERAELDVTRVQNYLAANGPEIGDKIRVQIEGANWEDGSQQLANALQSVIRTKLLEMAQDALLVFESRADTAREQMAEELATRPDMAAQAEAQRQSRGRGSRASA